MKKALMFGNYVARYHSAKGVDTRLRELLNGSFSIDYTEDESLLNTNTLQGYDMVISYLEFSKEPMSDEQAHALVSFVSGGGALLVFHNGISLQRRPEIMQLIGAKFTGHPPYEGLPQIPYKVIKPDHPVMEGVQDFVMGDEPYRFQMEALAEKELLLEYEYEDTRWPAGWVRSFGLGRVAYFANGHCLDGFMDPSFSKIIVSAATWCTRI